MDNEERTEQDGPAANKGEVGADTKYREQYAEEARKLCLLGATDEFLAEFFEVSERTINNWKKEYPEFLQSIRAGKAEADMEIASSLYESAKGFELHEDHAFKVKDYDENGKAIERVEVVKLKKQMPPDYRSASFWLRNRQPHVWRDKIEIDHGGSVGVFEAQFGDKDLGDDDYKADS
jgi:hypothetical protein